MLFVKNKLSQTFSQKPLDMFCVVLKNNSELILFLVPFNLYCPSHSSTGKTCLLIEVVGEYVYYSTLQSG